MAILDTSVVIDVLRGSSAATDFLLSLDEQPICSEVVRVEVMRGLRTAERAAAERLLHEIRWIGLDEPIARLAGEMGRKWRRSHAGISTRDLIVAATAQRLGAALVTTNVRDFPMFKDLQPPYEG
jgi:predicted nucleic acid-binding protein